MSNMAPKEHRVVQWIFHGIWITAALLGMHWALHAATPPKIVLACEFHADCAEELTARCSSQPRPG